MKALLYLTAALSVLISETHADTLDEFHAAKAKWGALGVKSYMFLYELGGAVLIAPACAGAKVLVRVKAGVSTEPKVISGSRRCPVGILGQSAIGFPVPRTIDAAFSEMSRYIETPPVRAEVTAHYDETTGIPLEYYVRKADTPGNDEGFKISGFKFIK